MAAKENFTPPPYIQNYFKKYGHSAQLPQKSYFNEQNRLTQKQEQLKRIENMHSKLQTIINRLPNGNKKTNYIRNLTKLQELNNAKNQADALLTLKKTILKNQEQLQQLLQQPQQQTEIEQLSNKLLKKIEELRTKQIINSFDMSKKGKTPLNNSTKRHVLDNLATGIMQVIHKRQTNLPQKTIKDQLQLFKREINRYTPLNGGRRRTHRKRRTQKK